MLDVIKSTLLVVHPAARDRARGATLQIADEVAPRAVERAREGLALTPEELTALFAEHAPRR